MNEIPIGAHWVGRAIDGRYPLVRCLFDSASCNVFETCAEELAQKRAAIKVLPIGQAAGQISAWRAVQQLSHPNLEQVFATGHCDSDGTAIAYVVTELADELLSETVPGRVLTEDEVRGLIPPVLDALEMLHSGGIVHAHLEPSNILVVGNEIKVSTDAVELAGGYMRREKWTLYDGPVQEDGPAETAQDLWAFGVLLVETLTRKLPEWTPSSVSDPVVPHGLPEPFGRMARACLRVNPGARCTAAEARLLFEGKPVGRLEDKAKPTEQFKTVAAAPEAGLPPQEWKPAPGLAARQTVPQAKAKTRSMLPLVWGALAAIVFVALLWMIGPRAGKEKTAPDSSPAGAQTESVSSARSAEHKPLTDTTGGAVAQRVLPTLLPAAQASIRGTVSVAIRVKANADGDVTDANFAQAGPSRYFARVSMDAARQWKFKPTVDGGAWLVRFQYTQAGTQAEAGPAE